MHILRIKKSRRLNKTIESFITFFCSFLLIICLWKPGTLLTLIQGDVGGWIDTTEVVKDTTNKGKDSVSNSIINKNNVSSVFTQEVISMTTGERIANIARTYSKRKEICSTKPESCARCVRQILKEAGCNSKVISSNPLDGWTKPYGLLYANSLWGKDIGRVKNKNEKVLPGDLVFFENTYKGNWWNKRGFIPKDKFNSGKQSYSPVVTHIEIAINSTQMVGKRNAYKPMSTAGIRSRFGSKFLGSITLRKDLCNVNT